MTTITVDRALLEQALSAHILSLPYIGAGYKTAHTHDTVQASISALRAAIEQDRAQRGEPAFGLMTPEAQDREASLQDTAPQPSQPAHTEAEVQELMEFAKHHALGTFSDATIEDKFRRVLGVPKP